MSTIGEYRTLKQNIAHLEDEIATETMSDIKRASLVNLRNTWLNDLESLWADARDEGKEDETDAIDAEYDYEDETEEWFEQAHDLAVGDVDD